MTEDLSAFFNTGDFAIALTYKVGGTGSGSTVNVIYDAPDREHFGINGTKPRVTARASDFASWGNTDTLDDGATTWRIVDSRPLDDGALVELQLEEQ